MEDKKQVVVKMLVECFQINEFTIDEILKTLQLTEEHIFDKCKIKD